MAEVREGAGKFFGVLASYRNAGKVWIQVLGNSQYFPYHKPVLYDAMWTLEGPVSYVHGLFYGRSPLSRYWAFKWDSL